VIEKDDLRAAVASGLLSEAQAASLAALADARRGARADLTAGDEPFELFKGFNEIFIVVGLTILATGYYATATLLFGMGPGNSPVTVAVLGGVLIWLLSEYFVIRRRMVVPAIALAVMWGLNAGAGFTALMAEPFMVAHLDYESLPIPFALTTLAVLLHWLRFRVPFSLAMIALGTFAVALILAAAQSGTPREISDIFLLSAAGPFAWITLLLGTAVFVVAMMFDMSDPHRVTRRSANSFWLHVIAAPAMVNTIALTLLERGTASAHGMLFILLLGFALIAIVIDRRSFLIAAVGYSVALAFIAFDGEGGAYTVLILGLALVFLGAQWERLRGLLIGLLSPILPLNRLPPSL